MKSGLAQILKKLGLDANVLLAKGKHAALKNPAVRGGLTGLHMAGSYAGKGTEALGEGIGSLGAKMGKNPIKTGAGLAGAGAGLAGLEMMSDDDEEDEYKKMLAKLSHD